MEILQFYKLSDTKPWVEKISESDWRAGKYLAELLEARKLKQLCGKSTEVLLLTENGCLLSFCTLAETDEIADSGLSPWIGFVYTFPEYRGKRLIGQLIDRACEIAAVSGQKAVYVSTDQQGLYENFGFTDTGMRKMTIYGEMSMIYKRETTKEDH